MNARAMLHPVMLDVLGQFPRGTLTSTYRSVAEQAKLRRQYDAGRALYPAERPGQSTHHTGLSFDFVAAQGANSQEQTQLGRAWAAIGGRWSERDRVHFEHPQARNAVIAGLVRPKWWL